MLLYISIKASPVDHLFCLNDLDKLGESDFDIEVDFATRYLTKDEALLKLKQCHRISFSK